jgi:hypothetical protein
MSAISTTAPSGNSIAALLADMVSTPTGAAPAQPSPSKAATSDHGAATKVQLSDQVKAILFKAESDQAAADRLQAFVTSRHGGATGSSTATTSGVAKMDITRTFEKLSASSTATTDTEAAVSFGPTHNFLTQAQFGGFSASVHANAQDGSYSIDIDGPGGVEFFDKRFGQSAEVAGFGYGGRVPESIHGVGDWKIGNVAYISFAESDAAAASASISTDTGATSASAVSAHASTITFAIDFSTGSIQMTRSDAYATVSAQINSSSSSVSVVA